MKLRLLKDLPEYPQDTVFESTDKGWYWSYKRVGAPVGSDWLKELLYQQVPNVNDDHTDFFEYIQQDVDLYYVANIDGTTTTYNSYFFWDVPSRIDAFKDKLTAEDKARKLRDILLSDQGSEA